jgi:dipeptidyl aminopeptidase/acylaminoacyl peptidase
MMGVFVSKDRTRALSERHDPESNFTGPWVVDLTAGTEARLAPTQSESIELTPTWSSDESRVFFSTLRGIYARQVRGGQVERLLAQDRTVWLNDRSEDGRYLLFDKGDPATQGDVWVLTLDQPVTARPLVATRYNEGQGRLSPDGKALAFVSDESGRREVYLDSFPEPQTKIPVSVAGGTMPEWRPDGRELYYLAPDRMLMAVPVEARGGAIRAGRPVKLFQMTTLSIYNNRHLYHSTTAGDRFLVVSLLPKDMNPPLTVLLNWPALVGKVGR